MNIRMLWLICHVVYSLVVWLTIAYAVFVKGHSGWWIALAILATYMSEETKAWIMEIP